MAQISDLKASVATQFQTSKDLLEIAKDINAIRRRLEGEGRMGDAEALRQSIERLIAQSDKLAEVARSNGRTLVDTLRDSW